MSDLPRVTLARAAELAQAEFRRHGFKAEDPHLSQRNGYVRVEFAEEFATGQAAFSQRTVTCALQVYLPETGSTAGSGSTVKMEPWKLYQLALPPSEDAEASISVTKHPVRLEVGYKHHGSGSNGFSRDYFVRVLPGAKAAERSRQAGEPELKLVARDSER